MTGCLQFFGFSFKRVVVPGLQVRNALLVDVKTNDRAFFAKFHGQGQADVAQADDG